MLLLCLGFGVAAQVRVTQQDALAAARTSDLVRILDDLSAQRERLSAEEVRLRATLSDLESEPTRRRRPEKPPESGSKRFASWPARRQ